MDVRRKLALASFVSVLILALTGSLAHFSRVARNAPAAPSLASVLPLVQGQDEGLSQAAPAVTSRGRGQSAGRLQNPTVSKSKSKVVKHHYSGSDTGGPWSDGSSGDEDSPDARPLTVTVGEVDYLYPGKVRVVPLTIGNPYSFDIVLDRITVSGEGTAACPARFLSLGTYDVIGPQINAGSTGTAMTQIGLTASAPEDCQGERFTIHVNVEAGRE